MKKIFISFPYTHEDKEITLKRVQQARLYTAQLLFEGHTVFSPALFGHDLIHQLHLNGEEQDMTFKRWDKFCYDYLEKCDEMHILCLEGFDVSIGVEGEKYKAFELDIPVKFIDL